MLNNPTVPHRQLDRFTLHELVLAITTICFALGAIHICTIVMRLLTGNPSRLRISATMSVTAVASSFSFTRSGLSLESYPKSAFSSPNVREFIREHNIVPMAAGTGCDNHIDLFLAQAGVDMKYLPAVILYSCRYPRGRAVLTKVSRNDRRLFGRLQLVLDREQPQNGARNTLRG